MGRSYLPAAGHGWALPFYDPIVKLLGVDALRERLIEYARIRPGHRVLDIGCGTGTLVVQIKRLHPDAGVVGLLFHHLEPDEKKTTLREVRRVLKAGGGVLHLLDFGGAGSPPHGFLARLLHVNRRLRDNFEGRITTLMTQAGFADSKEVGHASTLIGQAAHYQGRAS